MALPRHRRAAVAVIAAGMLALTACGSNSPQSPTADPSGQGQVGDAPSGTATASSDGTPAAATTTSGGGGGGNQGPIYPSDAKTYGLEILKAIANNNDPRIVDLSSLNTAQYVQQQNYKSKNGQWTNTHCQSGTIQYCHYYNQTGDTSQVGIETAKLGSKGAGSSVTIEGSSFATSAGPYVADFGSAWEAGDYAKMVSLSSSSIANHFNTLPKFSSVNAGTSYTGPAPCPAPNASKTCVALVQVGGTATLPIRYLQVDSAKIGAGRPNGIIGYQ